MSNVAGKAYGMNVVTPMPPDKTWINRLVFMVARVLPEFLGGLLGLSIIHFARWIIVRRDQWPNMDHWPDIRPSKQELKNDYMIFCSNFNGTWDQYIDAFSDGIPGGLDLFWYCATKYPHSIPITPFKRYIRANQIDTDYYYDATPGSAQRDIKMALRVYAQVTDLAKKHGSMSKADFAEAYRKALVTVQNDLGDPGYAPVASLDTERADINRRPYVKARWGTPAA